MPKNGHEFSSAIERWRPLLCASHLGRSRPPSLESHVHKSQARTSRGFPLCLCFLGPSCRVTMPGPHCWVTRDRGPTAAPGGGRTLTPDDLAADRAQPAPAQAATL